MSHIRRSTRIATRLARAARYVGGERLCRGVGQLLGDVCIHVHRERHGAMAQDLLTTLGGWTAARSMVAAPQREPRLAALLARIRHDDGVSYQHFSDPAELQRLVENDLAVLLSERFEMASREGVAEDTPLAGALPAPATPLVGRDQEVKAVTELVLTEGVRLVTLTGPGGVGKTRLAIEAASRLRAGFGDGVRFVDLAAVPAADLVPPAVAGALGLRSSDSRVITDLESYLRARRLLLVLDNFEHIL